MKKLIIVILILLPSFSFAGMQDAHKAVIARMNVASSACETEIPATSNTRLTMTPDGSIDVGDESAYYYVGQIVATAGTHNLCKAVFRVSSVQGTASNIVVYSQIWSVDASNNLESLIEESSDTISTPSQYTLYAFTFSSTMPTKCAVVLTMKKTDSTDYLRLSFSLSDHDNTYSQYARWNSTGVIEATSDWDFQGTFYE